MKTKKAAAKRFKITASGKVKFKKANLRHLLTSKSSKRRAKMRQPGYVFSGDIEHIFRALPFGK